MIFNIYYINFAKVYEIKMMISNVISTGGEIEKELKKEKEAEVRAKLGASFLNFFSAEVNGGGKKNSSDSQKVLETFEIKTTKSVILNELIEKGKLLNDFGKVEEGELIRIDNVNLSLENEAELRTVKLALGGSFNGMSVPDTDGIDMNNLFNSMLKDYAYKMKGIIKDKDDKILIKIPLTFENEFESSYSVDDLFIGQVSLLGIYKGKMQINSLRNSFQFFQELNVNNVNGSYDEIRDSQSNNNQNRTLNPFVSSNDDSEYHYIDLLAIVQNVRMPIDK